MSEQQLINATELAPQTADVIDNKHDAAAISRRPSDLVPAADVQRLSRRSDAHGLVYFLGHYALIAFGAWLVWQTFPSISFWPIFMLHAVVLGFLFSPLHECAHGAAFKTRWLNESALWITSLVYIVPPYYFRYFHLGHHRFTQIPGKDPSLVLPAPANFAQYLWYCLGLWFWWRNLSWIAKHALGITHPSSNGYVPQSRRGLLVIEARVLVCSYSVLAFAAVYFGFAFELLLCWLAPRFVGEPVQRFIRVAEHVGCEESSDLLANTRTTLTNRWVNALAWQMPYHAEHHLYPNVPFHCLAALHELIGDRVPVESSGYLAGQWKIIKLMWVGTEHESNRTSAPGPLL